LVKIFKKVIFGILIFWYLVLGGQVWSEQDQT